MKLYSDFPLRRVAQIAADLLAIAIVVLAVWLAVTVRGLVLGLADVGRQLERSGSDFGTTMRDAGRRLGGIPLVGDGIRKPFDGAAGAGSTLADAGRTQQDVVATSAVVIPLLIVAIALAGVGWLWLRRRLRFIRRATAAARLSRLTDGADLLALRALTTARARELERISPTPATAWRAADPAVVRDLAALELREAGVRLRAGVAATGAPVA